MLDFTRRRREYPPLRSAEERRQDFAEISEAFERAAASDQAARCSQCGIPFCQVHCPLHNNIPDWLKLTAEGRLQEAWQLSSATNTFPEICGRICPQDRLCEGHCVIEKGFGSVTIGAVEKHLTETAWEEGWVSDFAPASENGTSVGIIGAGPAGLAAAEQLRRLGYAVHVYDRYDRIGGLLIYGIPNFKLDKRVVERRKQQYDNSGIVFHTGVDIQNQKDFANIRKKHDAILIATGVYHSRALKAPGSGLGSIHQALDYLTASNQKGLGDTVPAFEDGSLNAAGKQVIVVGGGDTAMDCVRTATRQGASSVTCLYRRDRENMPGSAKEVGYAEAEGVQFKWLSAPKAFLGDGAVNGIMVDQMRLGAADASGRRTPEIIPDSGFKLEADMVITALGFEPENLPAMWNVPELAVSKWGTVQTDADDMTTLPGVFAAGDIVRGASLVVWAITDGRQAAASIHHYIQSEKRAAA